MGISPPQRIWGKEAVWAHPVKEKELVGGFNPSEKIEFLSWDHEIEKYQIHGPVTSNQL